MRYGFGFDKEFLLILIIPLWIFMRVIYILLQKRKGIHISITHEITYNVFVIYLIILVGYTLFPIDIRFGERYIYYQDFINYVPIVSLLKIKAFDLLIRNIGGNIAMFIPIGLLLPVLWEKFRNFKNSLLVILSMSLLIEIFQCIENIFALSIRRICDIDDIILNTIGGIVGFGVFKVSRILHQRILQKNETL